jgi:hypothetical protein
MAGGCSSPGQWPSTGPRILASGWIGSLVGTAAGSLRGEAPCSLSPTSTPEPPRRARRWREATAAERIRPSAWAVADPAAAASKPRLTVMCSASAVRPGAGCATGPPNEQSSCSAHYSGYSGVAEGFVDTATSLTWMRPVPPVPKRELISVCAGQRWCGAPRRNRTADPILTMNPGSSAVLPSVFAGRRTPWRAHVWDQSPSQVSSSMTTSCRSSETW